AAEPAGARPDALAPLRARLRRRGRAVGRHRNADRRLGGTRTCAARLRLRDLRLALPSLRQLRDQPGAPVREGRPLARLPLRRALVPVVEPRREEPARLAGLRERARALA